MQKMRKKSSILLLWAVVLTLVFSMSYAPGVEAAAKSNVKSVTVTNAASKKLTLVKGKSITLKVKVTSTNKKKASQKVTYKSSNTKVATVSSKGKITAKKKGTANITVTSQANAKKKVVIKVTVTNPVKPDANVKAVTVTNLPTKDLTLKKGKSKTLKVKVESTSSKKKVSQKVTYASSNTKVATVSSKGKITAKKSGTAKITITSQGNTKKKTTITVKVGTPVTGITLNQTQATIQTGGSLTLKATVKPKKPSNKTILWTSSDPTVATVSNKGVVKALKAGTATITATAADGSGKAKSATITVKDPVVVKEVAVVNSATVRVTLSEAQDLAPTAFAVKSNKYGGNVYNKVSKVDNVTTTDKVNYLVVLDAENQLNDHDYVQVTVTGLWGSNTSVATTVFNDGTFTYTSERQYNVKVGKYVNKEFYITGAHGYCAYSVTGCPDGIKAEIDANGIRFYGKPQKSGTVVSQIVALDEAGNTFNCALTWVVISADTISASVEETYYMLNAEGIAQIGNESGSYGLDVNVYNGSGDYTYSLSGETKGLKVSEYGCIYGQVRDAGDINFTVNVRDNKKALTASANVKIHVQQTLSVSGMIKDLSGNPIPNARVEFINKDKGCRVYANVSNGGYSDDKGAFSASLVNGTYDIVATYGAGNGETTSYLYSQELNTSRSGFDIQLALRRIAVYSNNAAVDPTELGTWEDADGESFGSGEWLYLKDGTYALSSKRIIGRRTITATINTEIKAGVTSVTATATVTNAAATPITVGQLQPVTLVEEEYKYYSFTPQTAGRYYIRKTDSASQYGSVNTRVEDEDGKIMNSYGYDDEDYYSLYFNAEAGKTYYIGFYIGDTWGSGEHYANASFTFSVEVDSTANDNVDDYNNEAAPTADEVVEEVITDETDVTPEAPADDAKAVDETTEPTVDDEAAADETTGDEAAVDETTEPADDETAGENEEPADVIPEAENADEAPAETDETTDEAPVEPVEEVVEAEEIL